MIDIILSASIMAFATGLFNRVRGTDTTAPGKSLYYVVPILGVMTMIITPQPHNIVYGVIVGLGYLIWGLFPHGEWLDHNRLPDEHDRKYDSRIAEYFVRIVNKISGGNDMFAMFLRHCTLIFGVTAVVLYFSMPIWIILLTIPMALVMTIIHEICLSRSVYGNYYSEILNGGVIGAVVALGGNFIGV